MPMVPMQSKVNKLLIRPRKFALIVGCLLLASLLLVAVWRNGDDTTQSLPEKIIPQQVHQPINDKNYYIVKLIENYNRTNVVEMKVFKGTTMNEFKRQATALIGYSQPITWWSTSKQVTHLHSSAGSLDDIINMSSKFVWTKPKELFRKVNGAFVYLWTQDQAKPSHDGNMDKTYMMKDSVEKLKAFFRIYGPYPVIMFHALPQSVRDQVEEWFDKTTIIHWVDISSHFPYQRLPDLPLLREKNLVGPGIKGVHTKCSNRFWTTGYLQMIRFRVLGTWEQPILRYFDYIQQIDTDISITKATFDPFVKTDELDAILGFYHCEVDYTCAEGLHDWILKWAKRNNIQWKFLENIYHELVYSVNFATLKTSFFMDNPQIMALFREFVSTGYIETRRWTEQVLYPYVLAAFTEYDRVYVYGDNIRLTHYMRDYPPTLSCIKKPFFCCA